MQEMFDRNRIAHPDGNGKAGRSGLVDTVSVSTNQTGRKTMPYIRRTTMAGRTIILEEYFSGRIGKKGRGSPPQERTKEEVERAHLRRQEKLLTKLMNANFRPGIDQHLTLEWGKGQDHPKDSAEMKRQVQAFLLRIRRAYRKRGKEPKYIYTMEIGPKGSRHVHMVLSDVDLAEVVNLWKAGPVHATPLYPDGNYQQLARYFIKYSQKTERTEGQKIGRRWNSSKNLIRPVPKIRRITERTFLRDIPQRKGYYIDQESVRTGPGLGENGRLFRECIYIRIQEDDHADKHLRRDRR